MARACCERRWLELAEEVCAGGDIEPANGVTIMSYEQALARAPIFAGVDNGIALDKTS
ncbi:hypothetical protein [Bradyrhizobium sp. S69]|uniref:hypothetical protein n=1 Tax=Bradyrhizobium sp. S69 TaxID=1641856 RepID=UPI00131BB84E|nr:hypothetical protein [Bradyrhizobium sp. S69]